MHLRAVLGYLGVDPTAAPETCLLWYEGVLDEPGTTEHLVRFLATLHERTAARTPTLR